MYKILLEGISDANNIGIYHTVTTKIWKEKKKSSLVQFHISLLMKIKEFLIPPSQMKS